MKIRSKRQVEKANKVFTDRKEPRKSFWDRYNQFEEQMNEEGDISVLAYYGIGGIGKTTLLKKLIEELKEHNSKVQYLYYDFDISKNIRNG